MRINDPRQLTYHGIQALDLNIGGSGENADTQLFAGLKLGIDKGQVHGPVTAEGGDEVVQLDGFVCCAHSSLIQLNSGAEAGREIQHD